MKQTKLSLIYQNKTNVFLRFKCNVLSSKEMTLNLLFLLYFQTKSIAANNFTSFYSYTPYNLSYCSKFHKHQGSVIPTAQCETLTLIQF